MNDSTSERFTGHSRFEETEPGVFELTEFDFETWVRVGEAVVVVQELPMLDAVVRGESVAQVVEDGWFETFERRAEDVTNVIDTEVDQPKVLRDGDVIRVETRLGPEGQPGDVLAVVNYIEGTWVEGIIPGYDYDEQIQAIRDRGRDAATDEP